MTEEIRLFSLWQPWASLIAAGCKRIETRHWQTPYRGLIAVHAAKRKAQSDEIVAIYDSLRDLGGTSEDIAKLDQALGCYLTWKDDLPYGAIVAVATLTDCSIMAVSTNGQPYCYLRDHAGQKFYPTELERACGNWASGRYAWQLKNIRPIAEPIPCKGAQGLRVIRDPAILAAIERQLAITDSIERQLKAIGGER